MTDGRRETQQCFIRWTLYQYEKGRGGCISIALIHHSCWNSKRFIVRRGKRGGGNFAEDKKELDNYRRARFRDVGLIVAGFVLSCVLPMIPAGFIGFSPSCMRTHYRAFAVF